MKLGTETGSLINHIMSDVNCPTPKVGDGATILSWTDRRAGTITRVKGNSITVQEDESTRIDKNGMSECQEYEYKSNPKGRVYIFTKRKGGKWKEKGGSIGVLFGKRETYHDFSF